MSELIGWWKGENNVVDSVNGNNAIWNGTPGYTTGVVGNAFSCVNSRLLIPYNLNIGFGSTSKFSIEFYFNISGAEVTVFMRGKMGTDEDLLFILRRSNGTRIGIQVGGRALSFIGTCSVNVWYKIKFSYDNSIWSVFLDDVALNATAGPADGLYNIATIPDNNMRYEYVFGNMLNFNVSTVLIDELKIYDDLGYTTTTTTPYPLPPLPTGELLGWWKGEDDLVDSVSGNTMIAPDSATYYNGYIGRGFTSESGLYAAVSGGNSYSINTAQYQFVQNNYMNFEFYYFKHYSTIWLDINLWISAAPGIITIGFYNGSEVMIENDWNKINIIYSDNKVSVYINNVLSEEITEDLSGKTINSIQMVTYDFDEG